MKLVLLGYMGSGKSTVGKLLAAQFKVDFIDLDAYIENQTSLSISEIFEQKGELFFRKQERKSLVELLGDPKDMVIALGGGTPCYGDNMRLILEHTNDVFYLQLSIPELINRLHKEKEERPLIAHINNDDLPEFIGKHIFERTPYYKQATHTISCTQVSEKEIVKIIEGLLVQKN